MSGKCAMQGLSQDSADQRYVHTYHEANHESHQSCSRMHKYTNLYPYTCETGRQFIGGAYNICMFVYIYLLIYSYIYIYTHKYAGANAAMLPGFQPLAIFRIVPLPQCTSCAKGCDKGCVTNHCYTIYTSI